MIINLSDLFLSFIGGAIIGLACSLSYILKGRILGISGIYYGMITFKWEEFYWKLSILSSIVFATGIMYQIFGNDSIMDTSSMAFDRISQITNISFTMAGTSGLLIGIGAKLCNGCTTGHGFCGLARLSLRSFIAFGIFIIFAALSSFIANSEFQPDGEEKYNYKYVSIIMIGLSVVILSISLFGAYLNKEQLVDTFVGISSGFILGIGIVISGMIKRSVVLGFLTVYEWNPQFLFIILGTVGFNYFGFKIARKPIFADDFLYPPTQKVTNILLVGSALFGFGWGLTGICPVLGISLFPQFTWQIGLMYLGSVSMGMRISQLYLNKYHKVDEQVIQFQSNYNQRTDGDQNDKF